MAPQSSFVSDSQPSTIRSADSIMTAVRPPEYFPRLAYCALMLAAERFVVADTFPFSRQSWHNRTKIRTSDAQGWQWLTVRRRHSSPNRGLNVLELDDAGSWVRSHQRAIRINYSMAPFYDTLSDELDALLSQPYPTLGALTVATVKWVHEKIGGPSELIVASELPGAPDTLEGVRKALDCFDTLITLPESAARDALSLPDIKVKVFRFEEQPYTQNFPGFVSGLSALDMLLNHGAQ